MSQYKDYLGDAVYADFDGFRIVLTTEDGISVSNRVVLEPQVYRSLLGFVDRIAAIQLDEARKKHPENFCQECHLPLTGDAQYNLCPACLDDFFEDDEPQEEPRP